MTHCSVNLHKDRWNQTKVGKRVLPGSFRNLSRARWSNQSNASDCMPDLVWQRYQAKPPKDRTLLLLRVVSNA